MVSITNQPFPIAKGEDAKRIAAALQDAQTLPQEGTLDRKLVECNKENRMMYSRTILKGRVLYED